MMSRKRRKWESAIRNDISYLHYYQYFKLLWMNVFKWVNLPKSIDARFIELTLFEKGYGLFFEDEIIGPLFLTCNIGGRLDVYRIPIWRQAYSPNNYLAQRDTSDSVLCFANYLHTTPHLDIDFFAKKLYNIDRTIDVNINAQKTPLLITCPEEEKLTFENIYKDYDGNKPVIKTYKGFKEDSIKVLKTDAPYLVSNLISDKAKIWNEAMTFIGIDNANTEKKERMVTDEVNSNNGQTHISREIGLSARKQACEQANDLFGWDIDVEVNYEAINKIRETMPQIGGVDNEQYNNSAQMDN